MDQHKTIYRYSKEKSKVHNSVYDILFFCVKKKRKEIYPGLAYKIPLGQNRKRENGGRKRIGRRISHRPVAFFEA